MIKIQNTKNFGTNGVKVLIYGRAGIGKTRTCATAPKPLIISAESGLLSLVDAGVDYVEVNTVDDVNDVYQWLTSSKEAKKYDTICLDSISEIAEVLLSTFKSQVTDARQAYGQLNDEMTKTIRSFRDISGKNVVFTAKEVRIVDEAVGKTSFVPAMPGKTLTNGLPFFFDEVFPLLPGKLESGEEYTYLQTYADLHREGKDRSGRLEKVEEPDLTKLFNKIVSRETPKIKNKKEGEF